MFGSENITRREFIKAAGAGVSANTDYSNGVAIFTLAKRGLRFEASVGGQKFSFEPL